jgi:diguanylate cyclase (GGDEF)-like protein
MGLLLLVDDDREFHTLVAGALKSYGLDLVSALRADEAWEKIRARSFDIILVDGLLPDKSGVTFIEEIRAAGTQTPVVFLSAFWKDTKTYLHLTRDLGVVLVLHKPIAPFELADQVARCLASVQAPPDDENQKRARLEFAKQEYAKQLVNTCAQIEKAVREFRAHPEEPQHLESARTLAHNLHGTAGSYGLAEPSEIGGRLEILLEKGGPRAEVDDALRALKHATSGVSSEERGAMPPWYATVLVVDNDREFLEGIQALAKESLTNVVCVTTVEEAVDAARRVRFDGAFINLHLSTGGHGQPTESLRLLELLRRDTNQGDMPIAFVIDDWADGLQSRIDAQYAGAALYLPKPVGPVAFGDAVRLLTSLRQAGQPRILVVDDDPDFTRAIARMLEDESMQVTTLNDPFRIMETLEATNPEILLLDIAMPHFNGSDLCRVLRMTSKWRDLPIIFLTGRLGVATRIVAFEAGGDDYMAKPVIKEELLSRIRPRIERNRMLHERMDRDVLTGLLLRQPFITAVNARLAEAARNNAELSVCLIDLDKFKKINDEHGHGGGDRVLTGLGNLLLGRFRAEDLRARWGGEEFALALHDQDIGVAKAVIERVLQEFSQMRFMSDAGQAFSAKFSAGVAVFPSDGTTLDELFRKADERLYAAKHQGGACVVGK